MAFGSEDRLANFSRVALPSPRATAIRLAGNTSNWFRTNGSGTRTGLTIQICPGKSKERSRSKRDRSGREVQIVQEGVPAVIPPEACYLGWQESLVLLGQLVEAEITE